MKQGLALSRRADGRRLSRCRATALLLTLAAAGASAQLLQGTLDGNVMDASQAAIPGAEVTVTNTLTGAVRSATTNATGAYSFPNVDSGVYTVEVRSEGFQTYRETGVQVSPNQVIRINATLEIGQVTETIEVAASAAVLQTDRAEVRQEITEKTLKNMPVPLGRNYQMLFVTLPGMSPPENAHSFPSNPSRAVRFSVNGTSRSNNNTRIDGASSTNIWLPHMTGYVPALESIEQVNVVTNSFDAEQGLAGGAAINLSIKSGTNEIHGSAFEYNTNNRIMAYAWNSDRTQPKPKFVNNQFGATIGGPIKKNKVFYFASYEGSRDAQFGQRIVSVGDARMRAGDLSGVFNSPRCGSAPGASNDCSIFDPMSGNPDGTGRTAFANNVIPAARIDPASALIVNNPLYPQANLTGSGEFGLTRNFVGGGSSSFFRDTLDTKVNFNLTDKLSAFARFSLLDYRQDNGQLFGDLGGSPVHPTNSNPGDGWGNSYSLTLSTTYVFNPNFVLDAYFGWTLNDTNVKQTQLDQNIGFDLLGIPGLQSDREIDGGWPRFQIDGFEQIGISNNFMPYFRHDPQWQYVSNANWTKGNHNIRFGFDFYFQNLNHIQPEFPGALGPASGGFRFRQGSTRLRGSGGAANSRGTDFNSFGSFLLGIAQDSGRIVQFDDGAFTTRTQFYSSYIRDRWQVNRRLTLSYGVRFEVFPFPEREDRGVELFDFQNNNILLCGVGDTPTNCNSDVDVHRFVPRIGLAYRLNDDAVLRAGYGITNDPFNWGRPLRTNFPVLAAQNFDGSGFEAGLSLRDGFPSVSQPDLSSGVVPLPLNTAVTTIERNNAVRGYIQSWNLTLEKRFGDWIGSAGYVATRSVNQLARLEQNFAPIGGGNAGRILNQRFPGRIAATSLHGSLGTAKYDSLQSKLEKRFSNGIQMQFAYTWAHTLAFTDEDSGDGPRITPIPQFLGLNYGNANQDIRHNFQFSGIYESPFGKGKRFLNNGGAMAWILGGWQLNNLMSWYSGRPFTVTANGDSLNAPGSTQLADCVSEPINNGNQRDRGPMFSPSSFAAVNEARFGTCGVNNLEGPGLFNLDLGLFRKFQIGERFDLQFRAEMFNVTNTPHFSNPNGNVNSGNFMLVTGVRNIGREGVDQRFFRFGLRLGW